MANIDGDNPLKPPEWLNSAFLQVVLKKGLRRGSLQILDCKFSPATGRGDNYMSQMFRVSCLGKSAMKDPEEMSFVIKSLPAGEAAVQFVHHGELFTKETKMLSETLPLLQKILNEIGEPSKLFAEIYYHQGPPKDLLILQDLCQLGFHPAKRFQGLDLRHSIMVVKSLASLHAASLEAIRKDPEITTTYLRTPWERNNELVSKLILEGIMALAEAMKHWEEAPPEMPDKLQSYAEAMVEKVFDAAERRSDDINVIVHGDTWTNNFMFKYENDLPVAVKFVDFQAATYNSPVFDLLYLIFTSIQVDVREKHLDLLLSKYFTKFESICIKIGYPLKMTLNDLKKKFFERLFFGLAVSLIVFPITRAEDKDTLDLNDVINTGMGGNIFQTKSFRQGMMSMLPIFIKHGLFDK